MKFFKKNWLIILMIGFFVFSIFSTTVYAGNLQDAFVTRGEVHDDNLDAAAKQGGYDTGIESGGTDILKTFKLIINLSLSLLGVIFMLLMIYGGFLWMSDQGNEEQVRKAKDLIIAAIIGLVIVVSSYAVSWFIINAFTGVAIN